MTYLQKKKLAFMSIVNRIKGFVRTITGVPPLTLPDCVDEDSIINYTLSGNSVQNGTPTPENPVEVESVGEKTINIFNPDWLEQGTIADGTGNLLDSTTRVRTSLISLEAGTYYLHVTAGIIRGIHIYNYLTEAWVEYRNCSNKATVSFTLEETSKVRFVFNTLLSAVITPDYVKSKNPMLALSETEVNYEPYGKYKIPVVCSAENFCPDAKNFVFQTSRRIETLPDGFIAEIAPEGNVNATNGTPGSSMWSSGWVVLLASRLPKLQPYAISYDIEYLEKVRGEFDFPIQHRCGNSYFDIGELNKKYHVRTIFNPTSNTSQFAISCNSCRIRVTNLTIHEGDKVIEPIITNIYLDEPLRKVGDYADYIDFEKQKVVRNVLAHTVTSDTITNCVYYEDSVTETSCTFWFTNNSMYGTYGKYKIKNDIGIGNYGVNRSIFYYSVTGADDRYLGFLWVYSTSNPPLVAYRAPFTKKSDFLSWLDELDNNGNPFIVYLVYREAQEIPISIPKLPTFKGTTIYTIGTGVQPKNMSATYYATSKE